ncbi:MAG: hypothetical protein LBS50_08550 [Prevotellaceae bacterium]|jgi:hypothetical protein|nr:hypothetical protein [Prevotellaceae bacterium]
MDNLLQLYKYFSKFVPAEVLQQSAVAVADGREAYNEIFTEIINNQADTQISEIKKFVFSANSEFVSDNIRNSNELFLFVEFGEAEYNPENTPMLTQKIAVTIAQEYAMRNNDNLSELLRSNVCKNILMQIVQKIQKDYNDGCDDCLSVKFPARLMPVEPKTFFGNLGWTAFLDIDFEIVTD